jgi:serine/threonine protein kinase
MKKSIKKNTIKRYSRKTNKIKKIKSKKIKSKKTKNYKNSKYSKKSTKKMSIKYRKNIKKSRITGKQYGGGKPNPGAIAESGQVQISFLALTDRREFKLVEDDRLTQWYVNMCGLWDIIEPDNSSPGELVEFDIRVEPLSDGRYQPPEGYTFSGMEAIVLKARRTGERGKHYSIKFFNNDIINQRYATIIDKVETIMKSTFNSASRLYSSNNDLFLNTHYLLAKEKINASSRDMDGKTKIYCMVSDFVEPLPGPGPGNMCLNFEQSPGIFSIGKLRHYVLQLARGIAIMHKMGIIHGDIKTGNILNRKDGDTLTPVIIDIPGDSLSIGKTVGTPVYLGGERFDGVTKRGPKLDITDDWWAFGITILLLLRVRIISYNGRIGIWYRNIGNKLCKLAELDQLEEGKYEYFRFIFSMMSDEKDKQLYDNSFDETAKLLYSDTFRAKNQDPTYDLDDLVINAVRTPTGGGHWRKKPGTGGAEYEWVQDPPHQTIHEGDEDAEDEDAEDEGVQGGGMLGTPKYQMINKELVHIFGNIANIDKSYKSSFGYFKCDQQEAVSTEELDDLFEIAKFATYFLEPDHRRRPFLILEDDEKMLNADTTTSTAREIQKIIDKWTGKKI